MVARLSLQIWLLSSIGSGHADRDGPELCPHAKELSRHAHDGHTHQVDTPPGGWQGQGPIVPAAAQQVQEVNCAGEVQAQLGPLYYVPQPQRTETGTKNHSELNAVLQNSPI